MKRHHTLPLVLAIALLAAPSPGCSGAVSTIHARSAKYPISLSQGVRDRQGRLWAGNQLIQVGKFRYGYTAVAMAYGFGTFGRAKDISHAVNRQVERAGGEAIVNLRIWTRIDCTTLHGIGAFFFFNWLPFWPGCAKVKMAGDIVKRNPALLGPAPAPVTPAPSPPAPAGTPSPPPATPPPATHPPPGKGTAPPPSP